MGNCCSNKSANDETEFNATAGQMKMTMNQVATLIKCQAIVRGYLARKRVQKLRNEKYQGGMGSFQYDPAQNDYDNEKVKEIRDNLGDYDYSGGQVENRTDLESRDIVELENHARYEGQWIIGTDIRQGAGKQVWPDGSLYEGWFADSKANGQGRLIHSDGDVYIGQWKDDKSHGEGVYIHQDGARYEGEWRDDFQHGNGHETWPDGSSYQGTYQVGKKHGAG